MAGASYFIWAHFSARVIWATNSLARSFGDFIVALLLSVYKNQSACSLPGMGNPQRPEKASGGLLCGASPRGFLGAAPAPFQVFQGVQLPRPFPLLLKDGVVEALHHQVAH